MRPVVAALCALLLSTSLPFATQAVADEALVDKVVVVVDDDVVLKQDIDQRMIQISERIRAEGGTPPPRDELEKRITEQLILERIQLQMAQRGGLRVSDSQLNDTLSRIASDSGMTLDQFETALQKDGMTLTEARDQVRREMLMSRLQQRSVEPRVRVTEREVNDYLASSAGRADSPKEYHLQHILIEVRSGESSDPDSNTDFQDVMMRLAAGEDFGDVARALSDSSTAAEGGDLGWRKSTELPGLFAPVVPSLKVGDVSRPLTTSGGLHIVKLAEERGGTTKVVEQTQVSHILVMQNTLRSELAAKKLIDDIEGRLQQGESFESLATAYSDDPVSGSNGGSLDWASSGQMVPEFETVMNGTAIGETSEPFKTQFGWHILRVMDRREQDQSERYRLSEARNVLQKRKFQEALAKWRTEIRDEAFVEFRDESYSSNGSNS